MGNTGLCLAQNFPEIMYRIIIIIKIIIIIIIIILHPLNNCNGKYWAMFCPKGPRNNVPNNNNNNNNYNKLFKQLQWEILGYVWPKIFRTTRGTGLLMEYCIQLLSWLLVNFIGLDCGD